jgi:hypothetical protein
MLIVSVAFLAISIIGLLWAIAAAFGEDAQA